MQLSPNSYRYTASIGFVLICLALGLTSGCGKKLFPRPIGEKGAPNVGDLQAQVTAQGVDVSWSIPAGTSVEKYRFSVVRADVDWEKRNCPDCPVSNQTTMHGVDNVTAANTVGADKRFHWIDNSVAGYRAYRYTVAIIDDSNREISMSNPAIARVYPAPAAPNGVVAATQPQGVLLQWKGVATDVQGRKLTGELAFRIERMSPGKPWESASPNTIKANSFLDQEVSAEQSYSYRIVPVLLVDNGSVFGAPSQVVLGKAPESVPPPPPRSVWVMPVKGALEVRWTEASGKVGGYHVYRRQGKETVRLTANPVQHPPFVDKSIKSKETYSYAVSAVSAKADKKEGLVSKWVEIRALMVE